MRVMRHGESQAIAVSVHDFGMEVAAINSLALRLGAIVGEAQHAPETKLAVVMENFNFSAPGESPWCASGACGVPRV